MANYVLVNPPKANIIPTIRVFAVQVAPAPVAGGSTRPATGQMYPRSK